MCLKADVVPSVFSWRTSPRKRKLPTNRSVEFNTNSTHLQVDKGSSSHEESSEYVSVEPLHKDTSTQTEETLCLENETQTEGMTLDNKETQIDKNEELELMQHEISSLKARIDSLSIQNDTLQSKLFKIDKFSSKPSSITVTPQNVTTHTKCNNNAKCNNFCRKM